MTKFHQFAELPREVRQNIWHRALPREHRLIGVKVDAHGMRVRPSLPGSRIWDFTVGAEMTAIGPVNERKPASPLKAFKHFIKPAESQTTVVTIGQVNSEARWCMEKAFPDVIQVKLPKPRFSRRVDWGVSIKAHLARRATSWCAQTWRHGSELYVRCNLGHDVFYIDEYEYNITFEVPLLGSFRGTPLQAMDQKEIAKLLVGADHMRNMCRVAVDANGLAMQIGAARNRVSSMWLDMLCVHQVFYIEDNPECWRKRFHRGRKQKVDLHIELNNGDADVELFEPIFPISYTEMPKSRAALKQATAGASDQTPDLYKLCEHALRKGVDQMTFLKRFASAINMPRDSLGIDLKRLEEEGSSGGLEVGAIELTNDSASRRWR